MDLSTFVLTSGYKIAKTYTKLRDGDVQHAPDHNQSIKGVPRINKVVLRIKNVSITTNHTHLKRLNNARLT